MQPTKEMTRQWLKDRSTAKTPPPDMEQIRRELGWTMLPNNKPKGKR